MRDHELELIAALVEGRLEDESEARALIDSSVEHRQEYEGQSLAYQTLRSQERVAMSDSERAGLRRDVWAAVRSDYAPKPSRARWLYRWAPVAAGMFVIVGVVAVLNQGGDDSEMPLAGLASDSMEDQDIAEGEEESTFDAMDDTEADAELHSAERDQPPSEHEATFYASEARGIRTGELTGATDLELYDDVPTPTELQECVGEAGFDGFEILATITVPEQDIEETGELSYLPASSFIAAKPEDADLPTAPLIFVDSANCELVHLDE